MFLFAIAEEVVVETFKETAERYGLISTLFVVLLIFLLAGIWYIGKFFLNFSKQIVERLAVATEKQAEASEKQVATCLLIEGKIANVDETVARLNDTQTKISMRQVRQCRAMEMALEAMKIEDQNARHSQIDKAQSELIRSNREEA